MAYLPILPVMESEFILASFLRFYLENIFHRCYVAESAATLNDVYDRRVCVEDSGLDTFYPALPSY